MPVAIWHIHLLAGSIYNLAGRKVIRLLGTSACLAMLGLYRKTLSSLNKPSTLKVLAFTTDLEAICSHRASHISRHGQSDSSPGDL